MSMTVIIVATTALLIGLAVGRWWWRLEFSDWDEGRALVWLLDSHGRAIPTRLHSTDRSQARVLIESLANGDTIGLGLRFDDGRVVRHHFGRSLPVVRSDHLSVPLPRAFLPTGRAA